jgi:hypothetical protein
MGAYLVNLLKNGALRPVLLEDILGHLLQTSQLVLGLADDPFERAQLRLGGALVEQVDVDVVGEGELALVNGLEQRRLAAAVLAQQAVAAAVGDFERRVVEQDAAVENERGRRDLDVARRSKRGKHTRRHTVREPVLVLLHGELLDFLVELEVLGGLLIVAVDRRRLGGILRVGLGRQLGSGRLLGLGVAVSSALCLAGSFGCGDHGCWERCAERLQRRQARQAGRIFEANGGRLSGGGTAWAYR